MFTHIGRWQKGAKVDDHKYDGCSAHTKQWHLVSAGKGRRQVLFDLTADPGEKTDVVAKAVKLMAGGREDHPGWPLRGAKKKN